jgi:hypothetical protein
VTEKTRTGQPKKKKKKPGRKPLVPGHRISGSAESARRKGLKQVVVILHPNQKALIKEAAELDGIPMNAFIRAAAIRAARKRKREELEGIDPE